MKSKIKLIIIITAAALILGGVVLALVLTAPEETEEEPDTTMESSLLFDKDYKSVGRLTVTNSFGTYEIHRYGDETTGYIWTIPEYIEAPVSSSKITTLIEKSATLTAQKTVAENAPDLSIYGLAEPQAVYKTEFDDSALTVKEVCIGDAVPGTSSTSYMCFKGENTVYTVKSSDINCFLNDKRDCIEKTVYTMRSAADENDTTDYSRIEKMTVKRKDLGYDIVIEYDTRLDDKDAVVSNSSSYRMTSPVVLDLSPDKCEDVMSGIFGLSAVDFAELSPTEEQLKKFGFDDPYAEIEIDVAGPDLIKLIVGNEYIDEDGKSAGYYARLDGIDVVYIFDKASLPWATFMPLDITGVMITSNYLYNLTAMNVTTADIDARFTMTGSSQDDFEVMLNGEKTDLEAFKTLYQFILRAPSEELCFDEVSGEPEVKVEIITADSKDTLEFYPIENRRTIIRLNGVSSFTCKTAYADRLAENILKFSKGEEIITNW